MADMPRPAVRAVSGPAGAVHLREPDTEAGLPVTTSSTRPQGAASSRSTEDGLAAGHMRLLNRGEALSRLDSSSSGRVAFTQTEPPSTELASHLVVDDHLFIGTHAGSDVSSRSGEVVAYEATSPGSVTRPGWTVIVTGWVQFVGEREQVRRCRRLFAQSARSDVDDVIQIQAMRVTGFEVARGVAV